MPGVNTGQRMKYPYTLTGKFFQFPWMWHWKNGRGVRFTAYAGVVTFLVFMKIGGALKSPANIQMWKEKREASKHNVFAPPREH